MVDNRQTHIIRKQVFELELAEQSQSLQWQKRLSQFANGQLVERLNMLFDQQSQPGKTLRIDRLVLTVNLQENRNWEADMLNQITKQVEEILLKPDELEFVSNTPDFEGISETEHTMTAFFYFLEFGLLPWWVNLETALNLEEKVNLILTGAITTQWKQKFQTLIQSRVVRQRLMLQLNSELLGNLAIALLDKNVEEIVEWKMFVKTMAKITGQHKEQPEVYWNTVFEQPKVNLRSLWPKEMAKLLARQPNILPQISNLKLAFPGLQALQKFVEGVTLTPTELAAWANQKPVEFEEHLITILQGEHLPVSLMLQIKSRTFFAKTSISSSDNSTSSTENQKLLDHPNAPKQPNPEGITPLDFTPKRPDGHLSEERGGLDPLQFNETFNQALDLEIYLRNAGLVLLYPFLPTLFRALGFAKDGTLEKPERAIPLLQYLAVGRVGMMEHELFLNKLLCGVSLNLPIKRQIKLTKREKTEADKLLNSVIGHWTSLGNTSADGLRGTFICREGKLSNAGDKDWLLQVEQQAVDILLNDLPWGLSMVKLPWMDGMLFVEWG